MATAKKTATKKTWANYEAYLKSAEWKALPKASISRVVCHIIAMSGDINLTSLDGDND